MTLFFGILNITLNYLEKAYLFAFLYAWLVLKDERPFVFALTMLINLLTGHPHVL